jgi:hypothetical protein
VQDASGIVELQITLLFYIITIIFLHGLGLLTGSGIIQVLLPQSENLLVAWKLLSSEKLR